MNTSYSPATANAPLPPVRAAFPRWAGTTLIVLFALILPVGYLGNEGEAILVAAGGLVSLPFVLRLGRPSFGVFMIGALAVWAAATFAWSPLEPTLFHIHRYKDVEALTAAKLLLQALLYPAFVYGALRLPADQRDKALAAVAVTLAAVTAVLVVEGLEGGKIYGFLNAFGPKPLRPDLAKRDAARGCYTVALLFWPMALLTWRKVPPAVPAAVALGLIASAVLLGVDAPAAAMILSLLVFLAMRLNARLGAWVCLVAVAVYCLAAPLVFLPHHGQSAADIPSTVGKESWHVRISIWRFASLLVAHRPLLGYGLDASRAYPDHIPMHPHDAALQLWLETGVLGALLHCLFWGWLLYGVQRISRADPVWAAAACATAAVYLLIGAISFGVWQEWWLALGAAAIACCLMVLQVRREQPPQLAGAASLRKLD